MIKYIPLIICILSIIYIRADPYLTILCALGWFSSFCNGMAYKSLKKQYRQNSPAFDAKLKFKEILRGEDHNCGDADYK